MKKIMFLAYFWLNQQKICIFSRFLGWSGENVITSSVFVVKSSMTPQNHRQDLLYQIIGAVFGIMSVIFNAGKTGKTDI